MTVDILHGKVALVTGGSRGIGREVARQLSLAGAKVAVTARNEEKLQETVDIITEAGGECLAFAMEVTDYNSVLTAVEAINQVYGKIDVLVNNAGIGDGGAPPWEMDIDRWWRVLEVNLKGVFMVSKAVVPAMIERGSGVVINMGSLVGTRPDPMASPYSVSKAALMRLTDSSAVAAEGTGVSFFTISPGLVRTDMTDHPQFDDIPEEYWVPIEKSGEVCVKLATGAADKLSGRFIHALDDFDAVVADADAIIEKNLRVLKYVDEE